MASRASAASRVLAGQVIRGGPVTFAALRGAREGLSGRYDPA